MVTIVAMWCEPEVKVVACLRRGMLTQQVAHARILVPSSALVGPQRCLQL